MITVIKPPMITDAVYEPRCGMSVKLVDSRRTRRGMLVTLRDSSLAISTQRCAGHAALMGWKRRVRMPASMLPPGAECTWAHGRRAESELG